MRMLLGVTFLYLITEKLKRGVANKSYLYAYSGTLIWPTSWHYFCILNCIQPYFYYYYYYYYN